jgi:hypothetical protein
MVATAGEIGGDVAGLTLAGGLTVQRGRVNRRTPLFRKIGMVSVARIGLSGWMLGSFTLATDVWAIVLLTRDRFRTRRRDGPIASIRDDYAARCLRFGC